MASLETRKTSDGTASYRVKWREADAWQSETFGPEKARALRFKRDVEHSGNRWPQGWLPGVGYRSELASPPAPQDRPLLAYGLGVVSDMTGIQPDTRSRYARQVTVLVAELSGIIEADGDTDEGQVSVGNLTDRHVARWINARERLGASPKTIANWHGLLFQIMAKAVDEGLRSTNPCARTGRALPRRDAYRTEDVQVFLTEAEFALIADAMWPGLPDPDLDRKIVAVGRPEDRDLLIAAVGTGARWGELTALQAGDCNLTVAKPFIEIQRAWKKNGTGEFARPDAGLYYLGAPKTRRGRRKVRVGEVVARVLTRARSGKKNSDLLFTAPRGGMLDQAHFYEDRWQPAVELARKNGLQKRPRFHDLRHTYAAWLISESVVLPEIQRRLGHESITTTVDQYGGVTEGAGDLADAAMDRALALVEHDELEDRQAAG